MASPTLKAHYVSIFVQRDPQELYEMIWEPPFFRRWATGMSTGGLQRDGKGWKANGPIGPVRVAFTEHNSFGVMDHWVYPGNAPAIYIPMRVIANGHGSEVMLTLFRAPQADDETFTQYTELVKRDLETLKALGESGECDFDMLPF